MARTKEQRIPTAEECAEALQRFKFEEPLRFAFAQDVFSSYVDPDVCYQDDPDPTDVLRCDMAFTEWVFFDFDQGEGTTVARKLAEERQEFTEFAKTQFYARFWVVKQSPKKGTSVLRDMRTRIDYVVEDKGLAERKRWSKGTLGTRIARANGMWYMVGQFSMHDNADSEPLPPCKEEELVPYDSLAFIANVEALMGRWGDLRSTLISETMI